MKVFSDIWADLREKRLLPVAVLLVAAMVAGPVLLSRSDASDADVTATDASATALNSNVPQTAQAAIKTVDEPAGRHDRAGAQRNPFDGPYRDTSVTPPPPVTTTPTETTPTTTTPTETTPSTTTPTTTTPTTTETDHHTSTGDTHDPVDTYRIDVRFGEPGNQKLRKDVTRLSPLPSSSDPFLVFLGVLADGKTAVFMLSSDATANGDGKCKPSPEDCETLEMRAGDTEFFDVATGAAGVVQYELDLVKISKHAVSAAKASRHAHTSRSTLSDGYRYLPRRGVLVRRTHATATAVALAALSGLR